jgi:hypothetical protein
VPRGGGRGDLTLGDSMHDGLRRRALRAEIDESREQDACIEERGYGHRPGGRELFYVAPMNT